jgi:hypothetical protein
VISVPASTATGAGRSFSLNAPATLVAMEVHRPASSTATVRVEGSVSGDHWVTLGASRNLSSTGTTIFVSTGSYVVGWVRANVVTNGSTNQDLTVSLIAR